jgi:hypothetical protein
MATIPAEVGHAVQDHRTVAQEKPSIDEWVLDALQQHGTLTLDQMGTLLPGTNWGQLFLAVDRLSRSGKISLWAPGFGDYLITLNRTELLTSLS